MIMGKGFVIADLLEPLKVNSNSDHFLHHTEPSFKKLKFKKLKTLKEPEFI